jgi:hypothetical protein
LKEESNQPEGDWLLIREDESNVSHKPDKYTKMSFIEGGAPGQVFGLNWFGFKYGTDDKVHAAAVFLSVLLLVLIAFVCLLGTVVDRSWIPTTLQGLIPAFTFVAGVAVGKSIEDK